MAIVPTAAADLFVDVLHPAGCRTVVLSGGLGRGTLALWRELSERGLTCHVGHSEPWDVESQPEEVTLRVQGVKKPVLRADAPLPVDLAERRAYCCEADIMLELFVERCKQRGVNVIFGGEPTVSSPTEGAIDLLKVRQTPCTPSAVGAVHVYLESASTNTGANCERSACTLRAVGVDVDAPGMEGEASRVALVQHPQAHRRACLTWERQRGRPRTWYSSTV